IEITVGAGKFVGCERERLCRRLHCPRLRLGGSAVAVGYRGDLHFDGDRFVLKIPSSNGGESFLVRSGRKLVSLLAGDAEFTRDIFRAKAHGDVSVGIMSDEPAVWRY